MNCIKLLLIIITSSITSVAFAAGDENTCDMSALPCQFIIHAYSGRHMALINIRQGAIYQCDIKGLAAIGHTESASGLVVNLAPRPSPNFGYDMKLDATQLKADLVDLKFDAENYSDIPYDEIITCARQ